MNTIRITRVNKMLLLGFALLMAASGWADNLADTRQQQYQHVRDQLQHNETANALATLKQLLAANPDDEKAYRLRIQAYQQTGDTDNLIKDYQTLIRLRPYQSGYYGNLGWFYLKRGEFAKAQALNLKAYELDRSSMAWALNLGHCYFLQGDSKTADGYYQQALRLLTTDEELTQGPLADFDLFIKNGWKVAESKEKMAWFVANFSDAQKEAERLSQNGMKLYQAGQYAQAERVWLKALELRKKILGEKNALTLISMNNLADLYRVQSHYAQAEQLLKETLALLKQVLGDRHPNTLTSMNNLAVLYRDQGQYAQAEPLYKETLSLSKQVLGDRHPDTLTRINNLAMLYEAQGHYAQAEPLLKESLALLKQVLGDKHPNTLTSMSNLAGLYQAQGHYAQAEPLYKETLSLSKQVLGDRHPNTLTSMNNLALLYQAQGHYAQAEPLYKETLALLKQVLGDSHRNTLSSMNNLGELYQDEGRYALAEPLLKETLALRKQVLGDRHSDTLASMNNLAALYQYQGQYAQAEPLLKETLALLKQVLGDRHPNTFAIMNNLGELYQDQGHYAQAEPLLKETLALQKQVLGDRHPATLASMNNLARLYRDQGHYAQAEPLLKESSALLKQVLGDWHPNTLSIMGNLSELYYLQGHYDQALPLITAVIQEYKNNLPSLIDDQANLAQIKQSKNKDAFRLHLSLIDHLQTQAQADPSALIASAFETGQLAHSVLDGQTVTQMALAYAAEQPEINTQVETLRDKVAHRRALNQRLIDALSNKDSDPAKQALIQADIDNNEAAIRQLDQALKSVFPAYNQIINPAPVPLAEVQGVLAKDEALLLYVVGEQDSYVLLVKPDKALLRRLSLTQDRLAKQVFTLRCAFYRDCSPGQALAPPAPGQTPAAFDVQLAHELYQALIAPIETDLAETKHLLTVADGALHSLPLHLLVKTAPTLGKYMQQHEGYQHVDWLIKQYAFTSLPSVKSLAVLRGQHRASATVQAPFIGFGDPVFHGKPGASKGLTIESVFRGDTETLSHYLADLPRLQNTADEIKTLARLLDQVYRYVPEVIRSLGEALGWLQQSVYLQHAAQESVVKQLSQAQQLTAHVMAFSTHGLLSHETDNLKGVAREAGLALPEQRASDQDGLLTGSEISRLNLNADWIVLSACNTATLEHNSQSSGLSELAKAFFLKGSRSILASHWYVEANTSQYLVTQTFATLKQNPQLPRAEALRHSMLSLINSNKPQLAHPLFWAPFVIIGEGGI